MSLAQITDAQLSDFDELQYDSTLYKINESLSHELEALLHKYRLRCTREAAEKFHNTTILEVKAQILSIQKQHGNEKKMMNMKRIEKFVNAMDHWGKVASKLTSNSASLIAFIWGPAKSLLQEASTFTDSLDTLLDAYDDIGQRLPSLETYVELFQNDPGLGECLRQMYHDVLEFHFNALSFFSGPMWKRSFRPFWKGFETRFGGLLEEMKCHKTLLEKQAGMYQAQCNYTQVLDTLHQYTDLREKLRRDTEYREKDERERNQAEVQKWLAAPSPTHEHEQACGKRKDAEHSGDWLFQKSQVKDWKEKDTPESSILWLHGIPGAGKTVLASKVVESCENIPDSKTLYFYCVQNDPSKNKFAAIIKSLLSQALHHSSEDLLPLYYERMKRSGEVILQSQKLALELLESCLLRLTQKDVIVDHEKTYTTYYVVVDGLDECGTTDWQELIDFFQRVVRSLGSFYPRLRVLFVSQHFNQIERAMNGAPCISITPKDNADDIKAYTQRRLESWERRKKFDLDAYKIRNIVQEVGTRANGMFLYARLVLDNLLAQETKHKFDDELERELPAGLEEAYQRILERIKRDLPADSWSLIKILLGWLVCARRLFKWREIQLAYCINVEADDIDFDNDGLQVHVREFCGSLIEQSRDEFVRLVHSTTSRYLVATGFVNEVIAEASLTTKCLRYLTLPCFQDQLSPESLLQYSLSGCYILQDYAVAKWQEHFLEMLAKATAAKVKESQNTNTMVNNELLGTTFDQLGHALQCFTDCFEKDLAPTGDADVKLGAWDEFAAIEDKEVLYLDLCNVTAHIQHHQKGGFETRQKVSFPTLATVFERNRAFLEDPKSDPFKIELSSTERDSLVHLYGPKRFKCPKIDCEKFFDGFAEKKPRKKHVDGHDRPFKCDMPECQGELASFKSMHDLQKHQSRFHASTFVNQVETFEPLDGLSKPESTAKWACQFCPKRYTRGFHLRAHLRTHTNERPFACSDCGKPFTRDYDRKRHEKTVHTRN